LKSDPSVANILSDTEASCLAEEEEEEEEAQTDEGVIEKINECAHENILKDLRLSEPSDFQI
jgi:hypothetical protein